MMYILGLQLDYDLDIAADELGDRLAQEVMEMAVQGVYIGKFAD